MNLPAAYSALTALLVALAPSWAAAGPANSLSPAAPARFVPVRGKVRVEGTSNLDNWQVESRNLSGFLLVPSNFPLLKATDALSARAEFWLEAGSLRSVERDGKPFSNKMDDIIHESLKSSEHPRIWYRLSRLVPKPGSRHESGAEFDAQGQLCVAGVTNDLPLTIVVSVPGPDQFRLVGRTVLKMTDFHIAPPAPKIALGLIHTDDEVKLGFDWVVKRQP